MANTLSPPAAAHATRAPRIVIVGGGAGGLQLATRLGDTVGRRGLAEVVLVDRFPTHFWKPLLHEAASGHRDPASHTIEYAAQAKRHGFQFVQGDLQYVDRAQRVATIGAVLDADGSEILPQRDVHYDDLVLAVGSVTNFFNVPGAARHALPLENVEQAEDFRRKFLAACAKADHLAQRQPEQPAPPVWINVIGAGATGVELAAALRHASNQLAAYRFKALTPDRDVRIRLIEGAPRVLPVLDERISARTQAQLRQLHVDVLTDTRVAEVGPDAVTTATGERLASDITLWAAGVAGPAMLRLIGGVALNRANQVIVTDTLQTPDDPHVYAFGDCAACPTAGAHGFLPPRAQVAHQQAVYLSQAFARRLAGKPVAGFTFHDAGTVVSLGQAGAMFQTEFGVRSRSLIVDGPAASGLYKFLYRKHLFSVHGVTRALLQALGHWLQSRNQPSIKLH
ncbi:pyridine nucleotide-disulfide oxidoreductase [Burkholderia stagnalis]|uniref:NAD(P)/FAD-dependent oxidoreductase n=1 Tax=Burkholderia stagnalis TaxID=1503054 RepID=UPI000759140B|nr:NAD(P)/FAD-dependent oxidoreductase [Burkholderia stagnalis]AOK55343.1 pyridine nucleotide-disulfide oxidoreductase [Burkholderia stagnalis]KVN82247.1 pyridine nucleotide-disulfide oxidoreductase [Burkholderia stagnalis]KWH36385.1 pyridine nucleotide-disulfide oxidoreductase [Burkholderia stagnalis]KWH61085.1 pyridine nucleotide-disulfide oxidoreductase [Burkholderia stagnalis]KWK13381.1 pyridine nucleotide-disulfide oxidoreductase [Burkholderia stagnalis]